MKFKNKATEEKVFHSAETLMSRYGVRGWNMNDLAEASGITKMTLYKIIKSKEQLIRDVTSSHVRAMRESILEIIRSDTGFMERMEQLIVTVPEILNNNYINNYSDILSEFPELEADIVRENEILFNDIRAFYQSGIEAGYLRKDITPDLTHHMVQAMVIYFAKYIPAGGDFQFRMKTALNCLINGIRAYPGDRPGHDQCG